MSIKAALGDVNHRWWRGGGSADITRCRQTVVCNHESYMLPRMASRSLCLVSSYCAAFAASAVSTQRQDAPSALLHISVHLDRHLMPMEQHLPRAMPSVPAWPEWLLSAPAGSRPASCRRHPASSRSSRRRWRRPGTPRGPCGSLGGSAAGPAAMPGSRGLCQSVR